MMNQCTCAAVAQLERIKKIARMAQDELNMGYPDHTFVVRNVSDHTGYKIRVTLLYAPFDSDFIASVVAHISDHKCMVWITHIQFILCHPRNLLDAFQLR
ncbi:MAG: hypothetical protein AAF639_16290, partial [Chloroflexota bacterium]